MGQIKIISDRDGIYEVGEVVKVEDLIKSYRECCTDESIDGYICRIPIPSAVHFIAEAWGLDYKFV